MESRLARTQTGLTAALLMSALLLGGGQGWLGDMLCQLLALVLIAVAAWRHLHDPDARWPRSAWLAAFVVLVPLLQLMPIPEVAWRWPTARDVLAGNLATAGVDVVGTSTLQPLATERALWWLLPALAMYLAVMQVGERSQRMLLGILVTIAIGSVILGLAQLAGGTESQLRFYRVTNEAEAVGFFANRNHFASLLVVALPLVIVGSAAWYRRRHGLEPRAVLGVAVATGGIALLILGLAMSRSRAGLLLGMFAVVASLPIVLKLRDRGGGARRILVAAVAIGLVLVVNFALFGLVQRLERDPLDDGRVRYAGVALKAAAEHAPLGAGFGGFRTAFESSDPLPDGPYYVNHAHNDYIEVWLEGGLLAVLAGVFIAIAFVVAGIRAWRQLMSARADGRESGALRLTVWVALLLIALHSIVDYPLRTTAMLAVAGLLAALLAAPEKPRLAA